MTTSNRKSGILLHISSLPCEFGIGDLGPCADRFVDFLRDSHQGYWQILPINPTDSINEHSPYSSSSAFAGNILFISPKLLVDAGLLDDTDINEKINFPSESVDFDAVVKYKMRLSMALRTTVLFQIRKSANFTKISSMNSAKVTNFG